MWVCMLELMMLGVRDRVEEETGKRGNAADTEILLSRDW